ncbi:VCBS repeat-containing protein [soil metagenome]
MFRSRLGPLLPIPFCLALCGCGGGDARDGAAPPSPAQQPADGFEWTELGEGLRAAPLPERPANADDTRFARLPVERTGIDFAHNWTPPPSYRLKLYNSLPGGGICIGDYDGDGLPDVFLTQPNVGSRFYRNLGDFRFEDVTEQSGVGDNLSAQGACFIDIDGDSHLDLFVCNFGRPNQLFINAGDGTFRDEAAARGLDFSGASVMVTAADYDRDGDLDLYLATYRMDPDKPIPQPQPNADGSVTIPEEHREFIDVIVTEDGQHRIIEAAQRDRLYRNDGGGQFTEVTEAAGITGNYYGLSATWWDFDNDGWLDLYVSNDFYSPDQLYRNNGDGTFTDVAESALPHTPWYSMGADVADINNDGWLDFMASDMSGTTHYKQKVSMGDMSNTAWFLTHPEPRQNMRNALYLNSGTPRFMEIAFLAGVANTDWTWSLKFADLDEDGWSDLFVTNGMNRDWTNSDLRALSNRATTEAEKMQIWIDSPQRRDANLAFRNTGSLRFDNVGTEWGLGEEAVSYGAAFADLDRDGDLDLIVNNAEEAPGVYRNQTAGTNRVLIGLEAASENRLALGALVVVETSSGRQTRVLTSSQGYMASNEPLVHFGLGADETIDRLVIRWPRGNGQTFTDLPANRFYRVTEGDAGASKQPAPAPADPPLYEPVAALADAVHRETPFNDYVRQPLLPHQHSQLGPGLAWCDINGDGHLDVFMGGASGQAGQLFINDGTGGFASDDSINEAWRRDAQCEDMAALFFDADGDGSPDLYVVSGGVECEPGDPVLRDRLYLNDGTGRFSKAPDSALPDIRDSGGAAAAVDFDRDGDLDLFVGGRIVPGSYPLSPRSRLLRNDGGHFTDVTGELAPGLSECGMVTAALWSDADGDGWPDLLLTTELGPVRLFLNDSGKLADHTEAAGFSARSGWHNSIAGHDLNHDGHIDYVVGNLGWNTKYHASKEKPYIVYYGDFEGSGRLHLVEAEFEEDTLFPMRGRSCSSNAMPHLGERFPTFHQFASASLRDIYEPTKLDSAHRFTADSLASGVWRNLGDGTFEFAPLPALAQVSPVFGIAILHANDDSHPDLYLAQNFYGPQPETGRADGGVGLLLLGNGDATFTPVPPSASGLVVPGDATSASLADIDGDGHPELFVAVNDGPIHAFRRAGNNAPRGLAVELTGTPPNRHAIGARITALLEDGSTQTAEIHAGSGYLSQSAPVVYLPRATKILVRWPDGSETTTPVDPQSPEPGPIRITIEPPER